MIGTIYWSRFLTIPVTYIFYLRNLILKWLQFVEKPFHYQRLRIQARKMLTNIMPSIYNHWRSFTIAMPQSMLLVYLYKYIDFLFIKWVWENWNLRVSLPINKNRMKERFVTKLTEKNWQKMNNNFWKKFKRRVQQKELWLRNHFKMVKVWFSLLEHLYMDRTHYF